MNNLKNVRFNITFRINFHLFCMKKVKILCNSPIKGAKSVKWYHILVIAKKQRNEFVQEPSKYGQEPSPGSWGPRASPGSGSKAFDWRALRAFKWPIWKKIHRHLAEIWPNPHFIMHCLKVDARVWNSRHRHSLWSLETSGVHEIVLISRCSRTDQTWARSWNNQGGFFCQRDTVADAYNAYWSMHAKGKYWQ